MTALKALHSSATAEHYTPIEYIKAARELMGGIDLDPASSHLANCRIATKIYTAADDGLAQPWAGRIWLNPPGCKTGKTVKAFWGKLVGHWLAGDVTEAVWLGFNLEQGRSLQNAAEISPFELPTVIPRKRIAFLDGKTGEPKKSPTHANFVTYLPPLVGMPELLEAKPGAVDRYFAIFGRFGARVGSIC